MREDYTLLTPENVELRFDVAGLGSRLVAAVIDYLILIIGYTALILGGVLAAGAVTAAADASTPNAPQWLTDVLTGIFVAVLVAIGFFGWWGYWVLFEMIWNGQTPGKRWLHLRVVREG